MTIFVFERLSRGWHLFKDSWAYLKAHRKIFKIPFVAFGLWLLLMIPVAVIFGIGILNLFHNWFSYYLSFGLWFGGLFLGIFLTYFVINVYVGMVVAAVYAIEIGRTEGLLDNLKGNWGALARFALLLTIFALIDCIVRSLGRRFGGAIGAGIAGIAMAAVRAVIAFLTTFTVAAIVIEELNMRNGIRRSIQLVRKYWVEVLFGYFVYFFLGLLVALGMMGAAGVWIALILIGVLPVNLYSILGFGLVVVILAIIIGLIGSLLMNVYYAKIYLDALKVDRGELSPAALAKYAIPSEPGAPVRVGYLTEMQSKALDRIEKWFA